MPFGVMKASSTFQRLIDTVLDGIPFVFVYLDDVIIASTSFQEHERDVRDVLERFRKAGLTVNSKKSSWFQTSVNYLGYIVDKNGIVQMTKNVKAISSYPVPKDRKALLTFIGMCSYYRPHLKGLGSIMAPLSDLTSPKTTWMWTPRCQAAFDKIRTMIGSAVLLAHPVVGAELRLTTDASDHGIGAVLEQLVDAVWRPLGFFSRRLTPAERNYSTYDRELTACASGIRHFRHYSNALPFRYARTISP